MRGHHADKTELLGKNGGDIIAAGLGKIVQFLHTLGKALSKETSRAGSNFCLVRLVAFALEIDFGMQKNLNPIFNVGHLRGGDAADRREDENGQSPIDPADFGEKKKSDKTDENDDGGAIVRFYPNQSQWYGNFAQKPQEVFE